MFKGGYTMVDCTGISLSTETKQTVSGIYAKVKKAYNAGKAVFAQNLTFASLATTPIQVMINPNPAEGSTDFICTASTLQLWVGADDGVTVVNMAPSNRTTKSK